MVVFLIHIPKTAGSSVKQVLIDCKVDFKELHVNAQFVCAPVNYIDAILQDPSQKVIITWRDPVEHTVSSFYFYQEYPYANSPRRLEEFIDHPAYQNPQTAFLFKRRLFEFEADALTAENVAIAKRIAQRPNTFFFLADRFAESLVGLSSFLGIAPPPTFSTKAYSRRFNFNKPPTEMVLTPELEAKIVLNNNIDLAMHRQVLSRFSPRADPTTIKLSVVYPEYPLNLVAGVDSIKRYRSLLDDIAKSLSIDASTSPVPVETYVEMWLDSFCEKTGIVLKSKGNTSRLKELEQKIGDRSERYLIKTRY